jgi:hypothetical protein
MIKVGTLGILLALGTAPIQAETTNYWVQNVNLALTAYVQVNSQIIQGSLPTKQFLAFLSGITNSALVSSQSVVAVTNSVSTNLTVEATNFWLLPTNAAPPGDLPRSYTVTTDYVLTPDGGISFYTNNINFTNDIVVTRTLDANVTYTFNNAVAVSASQTAYLFPELPAASITAVWTNSEPGTVFVLSGSATTNVVGLSTNYTYAKNPDFTKLSGAKLLFITPMVGGTNLASRYVVRYQDKSTKKNIDTDVSAFLGEGSSSPYLYVSQSGAVGAQSYMYAFTQIDFNNRAGTSFSFAGFDMQTWSTAVAKGKVVSESVLKQRTMTVGNFVGSITGSVQNRTFSDATTIVKGTITISGGKIE